MSTLYLATDPVVLAVRLADLLDQEMQAGNPLVPARIVVPNRHLGKWLRLWLARRQGIAINLRFVFLENVLWDMLRAVDPRAHEAQPELLDADLYRLLVLSVLFGEDERELAPLHDFFRGDGDPHARGPARRAWQLADLLGKLIRDYEYHRQDSLIQPWLQDRLGLDDQHATLEKSQRAVFQHIVRLPDGKRALLSEGTGRNFKTLPQYAMEVLEVLTATPTHRKNDLPRAETLTLRSTVHLFGLTQISPLHVSTLRWLGRFFDLRLYHLNPLVARLPKTLSANALQKVAQNVREPRDALGATVGADLIRPWGRAGAESLSLMARFLTSRPDAPFDVHVLEADVVKQAPPAAETVLGRLQKHLLNEPCKRAPLVQDPSLQIVGCPGAFREVETVYQSILYNLQKDPTLKQTDIAVLVTDMNQYRPILQAVFERPPRRLAYNLVDYTAAGVSTLGQALIGMLDLALESFTRTRVFALLLNPCFLARLGVDRSEAVTWLHWAKELGIYQGWDSQENQERGYPPSSRYGWRLGMQRLRLGQYMDTAPDQPGQPCPRFGDLLPYADLDSQDRERLDAFSRAVDGLLPTLVKLRGKRATGKAWADTLWRLLQTFLDVPSDRPEEAQVRDRLLEAIDQLALWDHVHKPAKNEPGGLLTLPLIREFIQDHLQALEGRHGEYLSGGVTISALQPMRPVPFRIIYVVGLGEDLFPGSNHISSFDLRTHERQPGDVRPAEYARFLFLETLLAAQHKIYFLYNNHDLQKDQALLPAVPLTQLQRYLRQHILNEDFISVQVPLHDHDPHAALKPLPAIYDAGSHFKDTDRLLALMQARAQGALSLDLFQEEELRGRLQNRVPDFSLAAAAPGVKTVAPITFRELSDFLKNPAKAALKRHLYLVDEWDDDTPPDDEPFVCPKSPFFRIGRQVMEAFVRDAVQQGLPYAEQHWLDHFVRIYQEEGLRGQVPADGFGEADQAFFQAELEPRFTDSLPDFLRPRTKETFCGPVLLGENNVPIGARQRFAALTLPLPRPVPHRAVMEVRLTGFAPLVWADSEKIDFLVLTHKEDLEPTSLNQYLFEPVLLFMGVLANTETGPDGRAGQEWVGGRECQVHVSTKMGLYTFAYRFTAEEAVAYLGELAADFLDPGVFDLLPFDIISAKGGELSGAYTLADEELAELPGAYRQLLEEKVQETADNEHGPKSLTALLKLAKVQVPADAFAKIRKRFRLPHCRLGNAEAEVQIAATDQP